MIEKPESGEPMYATGMSRTGSPGGARHATRRFIEPRGRPHLSTYWRINGCCHFRFGSTINLDHSCFAPVQASPGSRGLRRMPSGVINQAAPASRPTRKCVSRHRCLVPQLYCLQVPFGTAYVPKTATASTTLVIVQHYSLRLAVDLGATRY